MNRLEVALERIRHNPLLDGCGIDGADFVRVIIKSLQGERRHTNHVGRGHRSARIDLVLSVAGRLGGENGGARGPNCDARAPIRVHCLGVVHVSGANVDHMRPSPRAGRREVACIRIRVARGHHHGNVAVGNIGKPTVQSGTEPPPERGACRSRLAGKVLIVERDNPIRRC